VPLFEYECRDCHSRFEKLVFNRDTEIRCSRCGSVEVSQLLSVFAVSGGTEQPRPEPGPCGNCSPAQRGMCRVN
jgi:putative FmdB family regulatory protein